MIYTDRFCFVHIPRTGGTSITELLAVNLPNAYVDVFEKKHAYARGLAQRVPNWESIVKFSVMRSPWEIIASDWRHTRAMARQITERTALEVHPDWMLRMRRVAAYQGFAEFVQGEYLSEDSYVEDGGFWKTFCLGPEGEDLGVEPIAYRDLPARWMDICEIAGVRQLPLPRLNQTSGEVQWASVLRNAVQVKCWADAKFF